MRIGSIMKKIQASLTEEENALLVKELEKSPEKLLTMLCPKPSTVVDEMVQKIIRDIKEAMKQYGQYHYYDKGPDEVMDLYSYDQAFRQMTIQEAQEILVKVCTYEHGKKFAESMLIGLQDLPEEKWVALLSDKRIQALY